jgi:cytochrome P450
MRRRSPSISITWTRPSRRTRSFPVLAEMRSQCPVAHSDRYDGFWVVTRYDDTAQVIHDHDRFSSKIVMIPRDLLTGFDGQPFPAPPLTADPPFDTKCRKMLLPLFTRPQIQKWEETTVAIADSHIAGLQGRDVIDASAEYAEYIPIGVIARMMGVPEDDAPKFTDWVHRLFTSAGAVEEARAAIIEMFQYLWAQIECRRERPGHDLISLLMESRVDGEPLSENDLLGGLVILLLAGVDTTWGSIGSSLHHLAQHPEDRARLVAALGDPPNPTVTIGRVATCDVEMCGQQIPEGDLMLVSHRCQPRPGGVRPSRRGPHRSDRQPPSCLRRRRRHRAFPDFGIPDEEQVVYGVARFVARARCPCGLRGAELCPCGCVSTARCVRATGSAPR